VNKPTTATTQKSIQTIISEMNAIHFERRELVHSIWVAFVGQQHLLVVGAPGSGKSQIARDAASRILGGQYFEVALDETSTPDEVLGPPDIKGLVEDGRTRRITEGMLPEATHAFIDEYFNANGPVRHKLMPLQNERVFHNGGQVVDVPIRSILMGTNKLDADQDQAAGWDRIHHRHIVDYVADKDHIEAMFDNAVARQVRNYTRPKFTTITLDELDNAHDVAMNLHRPKGVREAYQDLLHTLKREGYVISSRRACEGLFAALANAYVAGHDELRVPDLAVLQYMFWSTPDQLSQVRGIVLGACNPSERDALALVEQLKQLKGDFEAAAGLEKAKRNTAGMDTFKKAYDLQQRGEKLKEKAESEGGQTQRIDDLIAGSTGLMQRLADEVFQVPVDTVMPQRLRR
jgi:MoxR-like ATPase